MALDTPPILVGMGTLITPNLAQWMNLAGGPQLNATLSLLV